MAFADTLRRLRLERFLSQAELARLAGMHAITITRLEAGGQAPSTRTVRALAEALAVEPRELASPEEVAAARMLRRRGQAAPPDRPRPREVGDPILLVGGRAGRPAGRPARPPGPPVPPR